MSAITVFRHGDRWAVQDNPDTAPTAEYETREAAESAARQLAGDREVVVRDDVDGGDLGHGGGIADREVAGRDAAIDRRTAGHGSGDDTPREEQGGL
jgi:hypothetical protein